MFFLFFSLPVAPSYSDERDVDAARRGNLDAFDRLVECHQERIFRFCLWSLQDRDEAQDAAQDTFIRAYRHLKSFRGDSSFATWLHRIAINVVRDSAKRRQKAPRPFSTLTKEDEEGDFDPPSDAPQPSQTALEHERRLAVRVALGKISDQHRAVLVLFDLEGRSYEECCALLELPMGTLKSRLNRARAALKEALGDSKELFELG
ncbi:ECF RNA polymerase sigma factor SigW [Abditibacteriota bacterium]|nr:ECF RNA polymerase sigma factor SigW [Abditibacteriota bacterium]